MNDVMYTIAEVVKEASALQRKGMDIHAALVKAASDRGLNMEQTRRAVESLNTLNTLEQFRAGEKTAEFPVADGRDVVRRLFQKEAAAISPPCRTPLEYSVEVSTQPPLAFQDQLMLKRAHVALDSDAQRANREMVQYTRDPHALVQIIEGGIRNLEKQAGTLETQAAGFKDKFLGTMQKLAESFQYQGSMSFFEFAKEASSAYGEKVRDHLTVLLKMVPRKFHGDQRELQKRASYFDDRVTQHQLIKLAFEAESQFAKLSQRVRPIRDEADGLKEALRGAFFKQGQKTKGEVLTREKLLSTVDLREELPDLQALARTKYQGMYTPSGDLDPALSLGEVVKRIGAKKLVANPTPEELVSNKVKSENAAAKEKRELALAPRRQALEDYKLQEDEAKMRGRPFRSSMQGLSTVGRSLAGVYGGLTGKALEGMSQMGPLLKKDKSYGYYDQLADSLRMQSSIQQVIDEDPILRERDPKELMPIIQTLTQVAPEIVSQPATLASLLRQATSGQFETLDPLTLSQLAEAQTKLWKNREIYKRQIRGDELGMRI